MIVRALCSESFATMRHLNWLNADALHRARHTFLSAKLELLYRVFISPLLHHPPFSKLFSFSSRSGTGARMVEGSKFFKTFYRTGWGRPVVGPTDVFLQFDNSCLENWSINRQKFWHTLSGENIFSLPDCRWVWITGIEESTFFIHHSAKSHPIHRGELEWEKIFLISFDQMKVSFLSYRACLPNVSRFFSPLPFSTSTHVRFLFI